MKKIRLPSEEQETTITFLRNDEFVEMYTSDSTMITKMDNLRKKSSDYTLVSEDQCGKIYKYPKKFISFRTKDRSLNMSEERRQKLSDEARERFNKQ